VVRAAQSLVEALQVPWLVLTGASRGPAWGALYESGAALVVSAQTALDATCDLMEDLAVGRTPRSGRRRRQQLIRAWRSFALQRDDLIARLETLTDREEEVLQQLYTGTAVKEIAEDANVTESTVRSQVKAILRKLDVSSQIAAVAVYEEVQTDSTESDTISRSF
jgi:DNA-binding NarL/FixJ family response regulator